MSWKRVFGLIYVSVVLLVFWFDSRYPALNLKALMGPSSSIQGISFEQIVEIAHNDSLIMIALKSFCNWAFTNLKGMLAGLLIAAGLLTAFEGKFHDGSAPKPFKTLLGALAGVPLGLCANCAAPVGLGFLDRGFSKRFVYAFTISSPSLNLISISLLITLLPLPYVVLKLFFTFLLVFVLLPFLYPEDKARPVECEPPISDKSLKKQLQQFLKSLFSNLLYVIKLSVPMMILAGLLGAFAFTVFNAFTISLNDLSGPHYLALAFVVCLVPAPILFDVIFASVIYRMGADASVVMLVLFGLGTFSVYPYLLYFRYSEAWRSHALVVAFVCLVLISGFSIGPVIDGYQSYVKGQVSSRFTQVEALSKGDSRRIDICDGFDQPNLAAACTNAREDLASQRGDERIVARIESCSIKEEALRENCARRLLTEMTEKRLLVFVLIDRLCDFSTALSGSKDCEDLRAFSDAVALGDQAKCNKLSNQWRIECSETVAAKSMVVEAAERGEICDQFTTEGARRVCQRSRVKSQSRAVSKSLRCRPDGVCEGSFELCDELPEELSERCLHESMKSAIRLSDAEPSHTKPLPNGFPPVTGFKLEASESQLNFEVVANRDLSVQLRKLQPRQEPIKSGQFEIIKGSKLGLVDSIFQSSDLVRPFSRGLGISSCDLNDDGWSDLVAAYPDGVRLYKNLGTEGFQEFHWPTEAFDNRKPLVVSCIDIDNDGKLDVWVGCSGGENFVSFQVVDGYMESPKRLIKFDQQPLTPAIAFSDIDSDGRLDIVAGGWTSAFPLRRNLSSLNRLYKNKFPEFIEVEDFFNFVGETLSILITTLAAKSEKQFLYVGNDYEAPDQLAFVGRNFSKKAAQLGVQTTPYHTMSIDSADIDNDLDFDLFATDLSFQDLRFGGYCELAGSHNTQSCDFLAEMAAGYDILDFAVCESTKSKSLRQMCINAMLSLSAERYKDPTYCNLISSSVEAGAMKTLCRKQASRSGQDGKIDDQGFRQVSSNHFYLQSDDGSLKESTREFQLLDSKYAWNAKFHDFDNDGFQDLFVVNGTFYNKGYSSNQLFLNQGGRLFRSVGVSASKLNMQHASTFTVADFDNDGDLDIIVAGVNSSFKYYQNRSADDSFVVELRDKVLNSRAIGARAVLAYRVKGEIQKQVREVKMSGGYMSYDSNLLHFGISGSKEVAGVEITWSDGSSSSVEGPFPTNSHLKITRSY